MKMHKNAGKAAKAQGNKVGPRSFLSFDKNDRQMMANLSEIGGRRYLHLKKVIIIISVSISPSLNTKTERLSE